ncbi:MAG: hypothetical protein AAF726_17220 [Planctomycetota bacterium]
MRSREPRSSRSDTPARNGWIAYGGPGRGADDLVMLMKVVAVGSLVPVIVAGVVMFSRASGPPPASSGLGLGGASADDRAVVTISKGEPVELADHLAADGTWTLFEYTADW